MTTLGPPQLASSLGADLTAESTHMEDRRGRRVFFGESSLPLDPQARQHEKRGRKWLVLSYFLCPCHLPITLALVGAAFGGTVFGAAVTGNALRVGIVMSAGYGLGEPAESRVGYSRSATGFGRMTPT